jgi:hypothetical protein
MTEPTVGRLRPCDHCGAEYLAIRLRSRFCGVNFRVAACRARKPRVGPEPVPCYTCGVEFVPRSSSQRYCSPGCRPAPERRASVPTVPCSVCGRLRWRTGSSLPVGSMTCNPCRRLRAGRAAEEHQVKPVGTIRRSCAECQGPVVVGTKRRKYCSEGCLRKAMNRRGSGGKSPAPERGYDAEHRRLRRELLPSAYGTPCALCGEVMQQGDALHLDHTEDRSGYRGFAHARCNVLDGARRGGAATRARKLEGTR